MKKVFVFILVVALSFVFISCQDPITAELLSYASEIEPDLSGFDKSDEKYLDSFVSFSSSIFKKQDGDENILISPMSLYIALSMLANGANNDTLAQLEDALGLCVEDINDYCYSLLSAFSDRADSIMDVNNSLWLNNAHPTTVEDEFLETNALYYNMDVYRDNLTSPEGLENMNRWIDEKTNGMIKQAVKELDPLTVLLILNTLYFESAWAHGKYSYTNYDFTDANGDTSSQKFISGKTKSGYSSTGSADAVRIYLDDGYYFLGILPKENDIDSYIENFDKEELAALSGSLDYGVQVFWRLPAFSYDYDFSFVDVLEEMGVVDVFEGGAADLSRLGHVDGANIFVKDIFQKTRIELDNKGIKAAAVTVIVGEAESAPSETKYLYFDRPFVYAIMDSQTNTPLFMGAVKYL
ncbi:MAG: serpin family protein [Bacillota bacterium]